MICQNCSNVIPDGSAFCGFCGQATAPAPPATPDLSKTVVSAPETPSAAPDIEQAVESPKPVSTPDLTKTVMPTPAPPVLEETAVAQPIPEPEPIVETAPAPEPEPVVAPPVAEAAPPPVAEAIPEPVAMPAEAAEPTVAPAFEAAPEPIPEPIPVQAPAPAPLPVQETAADTSTIIVTEKAEGHMGAWGYIWTDIVLFIPIVNIIMFFVWCFSSKTKKARKSYVRSRFIWFVFALIAGGVGTVFLLSANPDFFTDLFSGTYFNY